MSVKNKAEVNKPIPSGKLNFKAEPYLIGAAPKDPLLFVNSDQFKKIKNRSKKKR